MAYSTKNIYKNYRLVFPKSTRFKATEIGKEERLNLKNKKTASQISINFGEKTIVEYLIAPLQLLAFFIEIRNNLPLEHPLSVVAAYVVPTFRVSASLVPLSKYQQIRFGRRINRWIFQASKSSASGTILRDYFATGFQSAKVYCLCCTGREDGKTGREKFQVTLNGAKKRIKSKLKLLTFDWLLFRRCASSTTNTAHSMDPSKG